MTVRLVVWAALPLLFFTASIGKQPRYILPILPPLALLLARTLERRLASGDGSRDPLVRAAAASIGVMLVALGALLMRALPLIVTIAPALVIASAGAIIAAGLGVTVLALSGPLRQIGLAVGLAGAVTLAGPAVRPLACWPRSGAGHGCSRHPAPPEPTGCDVPRVRQEPGVLHRRQAGRPLEP